MKQKICLKHPAKLTDAEGPCRGEMKRTTLKVLQKNVGRGLVSWPSLFSVIKHVAIKALQPFSGSFFWKGFSTSFHMWGVPCKDRGEVSLSLSLPLTHTQKGLTVTTAVGFLLGRAKASSQCFHAVSCFTRIWDSANAKAFKCFEIKQWLLHHGEKTPNVCNLLSGDLWWVFGTLRDSAHWDPTAEAWGRGDPLTWLRIY